MWASTEPPSRVFSCHSYRPCRANSRARRRDDLARGAPGAPGLRAGRPCSGAGVTRVSLDHHVPVANAILTVENQAQAEARVEEKSRDAARVAVEMANLLDELL